MGPSRQAAPFDPGNPPAGVVFDLDGTLVDSYGAISEAFAFACRDLGVEPLSPEDLRPLVGLGLEQVMARAVGESRVGAGVELFRRHYGGICTSRTTPLPGVPEVLERLSAAGFPLGVATNKPERFARPILESLGLSPPLAVVVGPGELPVKPAPDILEAACRALGVLPEQTLYIGDTPVDVETARLAGAQIWLVPGGSVPRQALAAAGADRLLAGIGDVPSGLLR